MENRWKDNIDKFILLSNEHAVRMIMVGGGAVNFHGYQRHSADVDFWLDTSAENLRKLAEVFSMMGYEIDSFPDAVQRQEQNISVKFSPVDLNLELITKFEIGKTFDQAFAESERVEIKSQSVLRWRVLNYDDLIESKRRAARPKDLLDIMELKALRSK